MIHNPAADMRETLDLALSRQYDYSLSKPAGPSAGKRAAKARAAEIIGSRPGARVLDVGGEAYYAAEFEARGMVVQRMNTEQGDMHYMSSVEAFDGALAMHVLEHSPFPLHVLRLIRRALVPGGFLYVAVPHPRRKWIRHAAHFTVLPVDGWKRLLRDAGFRIVRQESGKFGPSSIEERFLCE